MKDLKDLPPMISDPKEIIEFLDKIGWPTNIDTRETVNLQGDDSMRATPEEIKGYDKMTMDNFLDDFRELSLHAASDGDMHIGINTGNKGLKSCRFRTHGGGGNNPLTRAALLVLMCAIKQDMENNS
jgi:hypothetical protein